MLANALLRSHFRCLVALGLIFFSAGCANNTIHVRDKNAIAAAGRVSWQAAPPTEKKVVGLGWSGVVLDGEVSYVAAEDKQEIAATNRVSLGNTTFPGPASMNSRAKVVDLTATARTGVSIMNRLRIEPFVGLEVLTADLELSSGGVQESDLTTAAGVVFGLRGGLQPHELVELYALYSYGQLFGGDSENEVSASQKVEIGVRLLPVERLGIFAAYREALYYQARDHESSDSRLDFRGPILGMELRF
jgi:hypothetical protein